MREDLILFDPDLLEIDDPETVILLTPVQAAERLGCSKVHVYRLINGGLLPAVDISAPGSSRTKTRVLLEELNIFIRETSKISQPHAS